MKVIYTPLIQKSTQVDVSPCLIKSVVELPTSRYRDFSQNMFAEYDFIRDCEEPLHRDSLGVNHCLLVLGEQSDDGILVCSDGHPYAVFTSFLPNARQFLRQQMHPSLEIYSDRLQRLVEQFTQSAICCQDEGCYSLSVESVRRRAGDQQFDVNLFAEMLSERPEMHIVEMDEDRIHTYLAMEYATVGEPPDVRRLMKREVTSMIAKHQLWLNGDGGECADFSKCFLDNYNFPYAQLQGANFDGAILVNVSFPNANLTDGSFQGTKFQGCDMRNVTATDACFKDAIFRDSDLAWSSFKHCNLKSAVFTGCELDYVGITDCCIEDTRFDEFGRLPTEMRDCSYEEEAWGPAQSVEMKL